MPPTTNSLNRVRSGDRPRPAISFTSPKLTRKPSLPGPLPRSPYVTTTRHREALQSYKPTNAQGSRRVPTVTDVIRPRS